MVCGKEPDIAPFLCRECFDKFERFDACPDSAAAHADNPADGIRALFWFDEHIQKLVHGIKYRDMPYVGKFLGKSIGEHYRSSEFSTCDALIPVPLHAVRKRERTYNQSAQIARGIASVWKVPVQERVLKRCRNTQTQTKLNKEERRENIRGAFRVRDHARVPKRICLVDDVFTTGATTLEAARALKDAGAESVYILTVATPRKDH
ncbi:MAG: ComF family protein [Candidatus Marinimicrobia bacterium]|nr:ComF family protein [Candidatus Neomarinimicrobiota bacterium]